MSDWTLRPATDDDHPFIFRAWLKGYWPHFPGRVCMDEREFTQRWHGVIERLLARHGATVAEVGGVLVGFACADSELACLHWCYVKQAFRGLGIARDLIRTQAGIGGACSHYSPRLSPRSWWFVPMNLEPKT